ncbi:MAG: lipoyl(octanoyl) transferase LipB [Burkholderiales bacterium]|nr:lipoyl(octanoyl) transferase LipB [Phycisphaerae bacterium]
MKAVDLSTLDYRTAWQEQERVHADVLSGGEETILLVEHPPVITFGRRADDSAKHLIASAALLESMGVAVVESDRGGDITFHGPGQLVAYPIVRIADHKLSVGAYVKALEHAAIRSLAHFGIAARLDPGAIGVWVEISEKRRATSDEGTDAHSSLVAHGSSLGKICALGVRIKRGVSMHGIALNVTTDLSYFNLIIPCGLSERPVTSMQQMMGERTPAMVDVKKVVAESIISCVTSFARNNGAR